ncbi:hypothetical protein [Streptomyces sp. NPDC057460]|uniref:hypothetical protein n=1 Tax=Streptomyces sp. NPDC057460 TaxID=3346141 RepID=UPI0036996A7E
MLLVKGGKGLRVGDYAVQPLAGLHAGVVAEADQQLLEHAERLGSGALLVRQRLAATAPGCGNGCGNRRFLQALLVG